MPIDYGGKERRYDLIVTSCRKNDFPLKGYVLVATSNARETFKRDQRIAFLQQVKQIANGRPLVVKLHPNENRERAIREIKRFLPEALIITDGNIYPIIANCDVLIKPDLITLPSFASLQLSQICY